MLTEFTNYLASADKFDIQIGPYNRVQNTEKLIKFRDASSANRNWVYSPEVGPFRVLGPERITEIVNESSNIDAVLRLNEAAINLFRKLYEQLRSSIKSEKFSPPSLPVSYPSILGTSNLFDSQGNTLLTHCFEAILKNKVDFFAIDRFVALGGDLNAPITFFRYNLIRVNALPLNYLWSKLGVSEDSELNAKILKLMDYLVQKGTKIDRVFGLKNDNVISGMRFPLSFLSEVLTWYLNKGGDINFKNGEGNSFLHLALNIPYMVPRSDIQAATQFVANGIDVSFLNLSGDHPIHLLCHYGDNNDEANTLLKSILEKAPTELNARDGNGHTPLYWSIRTGKQLFINTITEAKFESIFSDERKYLDAFVAFINEDVRQFLFDRSGEWDYSKKILEKKCTKIYMPMLESILPFVGGSKENLRKLLIAKHEGTTMLHHFATTPILGFLDNEDYIFRDDFFLKNDAGETVLSIAEKTDNSFLLIVACYNLNKEDVKELLEKNISLNICANGGQSLLHLTLSGCVQAGEETNSWNIGFSIFQKLLVKGINPDLADQNGNTPLLQAINLKNNRVNPFILELLNYGANTTKANKDGITPRKRIRDFPSWDIVKKGVLGAPHH